MDITLMAGKGLALLFSGGLDSFCTHLRLKQMGLEHDLVMIDCGTQTNRYEKTRLNDLFYRHLIDKPVGTIKSIDISDLEEQSGFVPLRNLLFAAMPVMHGYDSVALAAVRGEGSLDKSRKFFRDTSDLFSYILDKPVHIYSPVDHVTKTQLIWTMLDTGQTTADDLRMTTSCYQPFDASTGRCGTCAACVRRWAAMVLNNIYEPYDFDPSASAKWLLATTRPRRIFEQPFGRWPDMILTTKELRDAVEHIKKNTMS